MARGGVTDVRFQGLSVWPRRPTPRDERKSRWSFRATWGDTLALLEDELRRIDARSIVVEAGFAPGDIRLDGWPRADARQPQHPGVILGFESRHGPLRYLTDTYEDWRHNVRAIALGLGALRAVDRYGITYSGEQYTGWEAIGTGNAGDLDDARRLASKAEAERLLVVTAQLTDVAGLPGKALYAKALIKAHPDHGGSTDALEAVRRAGALLGVA